MSALGLGGEEGSYQGVSSGRPAVPGSAGSTGSGGSANLSQSQLLQQVQAQMPLQSPTPPPTAPAAAPSKRKGRKVKLTREERLEVQRYENTISDLERRLGLAEERAASMEKERDEAVARADNATDERDKIAAFLKDRIREKEAAAREGLEAQARLQESLDQSVADGEAAVERERELAREREDSLRAEIASLKDQLHQLVAFKTIKDHVEKEIAETKRALEEERRAHKEALGEVERKALKEKEDLKKERARQMREISERISKMTNDQLEVITKRTILENSTMSTQLSYQSKRTEKIFAENEALVRRNAELKQEKDLYENLQQQIAKKNKILQRNAERGKEALRQAEVEIASLRTQIESGGQDSARIDEIRGELLMREEELRSAQAAYHECVTELDAARAAHDEIRAEFSRVLDTRNETAALLMAAIEDVRAEIEASGVSANAAADPSMGDGGAGVPLGGVRFDTLGPREREAVLRSLFSKLNAFTSASLAAAQSQQSIEQQQQQQQQGQGQGQGQEYGEGHFEQPRAAGGSQRTMSAMSRDGQPAAAGAMVSSPTPPGSSHSVRFPRIPTARSQLSSQGSEVDFSSAHVSNYFNFFGNPFPASPGGGGGGGRRQQQQQQHSASSYRAVSQGSHGAPPGVSYHAQHRHHQRPSLPESRNASTQTDPRGRVYKSDRIGDGARILAGAAGGSNPSVVLVAGSGDQDAANRLVASSAGGGSDGFEVQGDRPWGRKSQMVPLTGRGPSTYLKRGGGR